VRKRQSVVLLLIAFVALLAMLTGRLEAQRRVFVPNTAYRAQYYIRQSPTALCWDRSYSYSQSCSGTCSYHGGVAVWYTPYCGLGRGAAPHAPPPF
jgi:hypothetical protein